MNATPFLSAFKGNFKNMLRWEQLDALWDAVRHRADGPWYVYAVGEAVPIEPVDDARLHTFLTEIDALLRSEHEEDYCGIVYADDPAVPSFIKIYDPNNLGSVCGSGSQPPPLPGWILCTMPPDDLSVAFAPPGNRRRWWQRLFGGAG
jgi:hypothetical protein